MKLTSIDMSRVREPNSGVLSDFEIGQHVARHYDWMLGEDDAVYSKKSGIFDRPRRVAVSLTDLGRIMRTLQPRPAAASNKNQTFIYWERIPDVQEIQQLGPQMP